MWYQIVCLVILSVLSAILYRLGGSKDTLFRDLGCSAVQFIALQFMFNNWSWQFLLANFLSMGLLYGALTTYWKKKGTDAKWWNWLLTGLGYSLSIIPICIVTGLWVGFFIRLIVLTGLVVAVSELSSDVTVEECGRGFLIPITLLCLKTIF